MCLGSRMERAVGREEAHSAVMVSHQGEPFVLVKVFKFYLRSKRKVTEGFKSGWVAWMIATVAK